jgi:hypothetical protein
MIYIVYTSTAAMPSSCWGRYRNVMVVGVNYYDYNRGFFPSNARQKQVRVARHLGHHCVGKTERCAYARACREAERIALELNAAGDAATIEDIIGAGGSA